MLSNMVLSTICANCVVSICCRRYFRLNFPRGFLCRRQYGCISHVLIYVTVLHNHIHSHSHSFFFCRFLPYTHMNLLIFSWKIHFFLPVRQHVFFFLKEKVIGDSISKSAPFIYSLFLTSTEITILTNSDTLASVILTLAVMRLLPLLCKS